MVIMPPTTTMASGRCVCAPMRVDKRRRQQAEDGRQGGHHHRPHPLFGPLHDRVVAAAMPWPRSWLKYEIISRPSMMATPNMRDEADRGRDAEVACPSAAGPRCRPSTAR